MTYTQAIAKAKRLAAKNSREYFVLNQYEEFNGSQYQVTDTEGLETFWCGISESRIIFCTWEAE